MKRWLLRRLPSFSDPTAPFLMHGGFLCLECLLLARPESHPYTPHICQRMGLNCVFCWKESWVGVSWSCHTRLSGKERDPLRKRTEVYVSCPRAVRVPKKSCKGSPNSDAPQRTQEPTQGEEEDLMSNNVVHFYC